ncbi:MAG: ribonuclease E/G [Bacteroidetes bacterium QS_8_68_15]|nr:MAG: ribonuclease E/G [Bacteroidetes bacterium QS_8_68_15]
MAKEIVVNARKDQTRIAIVEDGDLAELYIENPEHKRTIGNIVLGRVRKVMPSIQAAFVDIGQPSDAFLHFSDVSDNLPEVLDFLKMDPPRVGEVDLPEGGKGGRSRRSKRKGGASPEDLLNGGQHILAKIAKEPIADKGSRVSTDLSMAGRFLVLVPLTEFIAVSKKISNSKERRRLKALTRSLLPDGFGAIVRTVAEGRDAKSLDRDLELLLNRWNELQEHLADKPSGPVTLYEDVDMVSSIIRDEFSSDYRRIMIDNPNLYRSIRGYVKAVAPEISSSVLLHTEQTSVFEAAGIQSQVDRAFERRVELPSGGYLFIERTEAMHVVDVNSGRSGKGKSQEENSVDVNLEAARVIAKQTRLRDLGGMMSDFGLVQITRQRLRPSITTTFSPEDFANRDAEAPGEEPGEDRASSIADEASGPMSAARRDELDHLRREVARLKKEVEEPHKKAERLKEDMRASREERRQMEKRKRRLQGKASRLEKEAEDARKELKQLRKEKQELSEQADRRAKEARREFSEDGVPPERLASTLERWLEDYAEHSSGRPLVLRVHPYAAAYLARSVPSYPARWFGRHLVRVRVEADQQLGPLDFRFEDPHTGDDLTDRRGRLEQAKTEADDGDAQPAAKKTNGTPDREAAADAEEEDEAVGA